MQQQQYIPTQTLQTCLISPIRMNLKTVMFGRMLLSLAQVDVKMLALEAEEEGQDDVSDEEFEEDDDDRK